ncbi:MAG: YHS domain-containing (seleno)protein [Acidiferrobacterales bacterium]
MLRKQLLVVIGLLLLLPLAYAGKSPVFATSDGAIRGHDPVAYFTERKPTKGSNQYTFEWKGEKFKFASAENLALFEANPEKYAPQYGGYCAYALSEGYTASTVPEAWTIVDDKLYLNYSLGVRKRWRRDIASRIAAADKNWPGVLN